MNHNYTINMNNITLYPLKKGEIEQLRVLRNMECNRSKFIYQGIIEKDQQINWYENYLDNCRDIMFSIYLKNTQIFIGAVALYNIDTAKKNAEFGRIIIDKEKAGKNGLGYEATLAVCIMGFKHLKLDEIYLEVFTDNYAAIKIYEKVGFNLSEKYIYNDRELLRMNIKSENVINKNIGKSKTEMADKIIIAF